MKDTYIYDLPNVPSVEEYTKGLEAIRDRLSDDHLCLLVEQYFAPDRKVTASELARLARIRGGHSRVNLLYGQMGKWLCQVLGVYPGQRHDSTYRWWNMWSTGWQSGSGFIWKMRSEVAWAIEILGWVVSDSDESAKNHAFNERFLVEGAVNRVPVNLRERNRVARARCIAHYGARCSVCSMSFEEVYGEEARGYIHVHHINPLAGAEGEREVDPVRDLRPVCPNCHAVIHLRGRNRTIEEVQQMLKLSSLNLDKL